MKRYIALGLLLVLFYQMFGNYATFKLWQASIKSTIKHQILQGLPANQVTLLVINPQQSKQIIWQDAGEFIYQGNWYDVIEVKTLDSLTYYRCYHDKKEQKLIEKFADLIDFQLFKKEHATENAKQIFKKIFDEVSYLYIFKYSLNQFLSKCLRIDLIAKLTKQAISKNYPPPELG